MTRGGALAHRRSGHPQRGIACSGRVLMATDLPDRGVVRTPQWPPPDPTTPDDTSPATEKVPGGPVRAVRCLTAPLTSPYRPQPRTPDRGRPVLQIRVRRSLDPPARPAVAAL